MTDFGDVLAGSRLMAIFRGLPLPQTVELAHQAWDLGISCVEVPVQTPEAAATLAALVREGADRGVTVGAGTVTSTERLEWAIDAGASFTVAPGFDPEIARGSVDAGLAHLPGVATPSDIQQAHAAGFTWLKGFPAAQLTPGWFRAMRGPFPEIAFVATGGIDARNAAAFLDAGCRAVAIGSALARPDARVVLAELVSG